MASTQMASCIFLTLFFLLNIDVSIGSADPTWDQRELVVKQGVDDVVIKCNIDLSGDPFGVVRIFRKYENGNDNEKSTEQVISENEEVKSPYAETGRYHVDYNTDAESGDKVATLTIEGVRGEDAGKYGCVSIDDDDKVAFVDVEVQVPIEDVYMISISDATEIRVAEGATAHLHQDKQMGVGCVVTVDGSLTKPNVVITVDGEDRTDLFKPLVNSDKKEDGETGQITFYTTVKYTYLTTVPDNELNQKNLTCVATADNFPSRRASAYLDVKFKPVITCPMYMVHTPKDEPVTIKCVLRSSPGAMITWSQGDDRNQATEVDTQPDSSISIREMPVNEDTTDLELVIDKVSSKHFTKYYLTATNDLGTNEVTITLKKEKSTDWTPKAEPGNQPSNSIDNPGEDPKADNVVSNGSTAVMVSVPLLLAQLIFLVWSRH